MVEEEKVPSNAVFRYRVGTILIWLGVSVWLPFLFLKVIGQDPPFLAFLPFHLIGVISGARLRSIARKELGLVPQKINPLSLAGHILIILGILVWAPYLYLKLVLGQPVEVLSFLPYHLIGVLGGIFLLTLRYLLERYKNRPS